MFVLLYFDVKKIFKKYILDFCKQVVYFFNCNRYIIVGYSVVTSKSSKFLGILFNEFNFFEPI